MKQISDVIVIGSGIIGASIAFALTQAARYRITLIEKGPLASGMTRRDAGIQHPFHSHPSLAKLALASFPFYNDSALALGTDKRGFVKTGAALVGSDTDTAKIFARAQMLAPLTSDVAPNARGALAARFPGVSDTLPAGLFTPNAGYADAFQFAQRMIQVTQARGARILTGTHVKHILVNEGRAQGVVTTTGEFQAPLVIVAAGGWSEKLLAPLGIALPLQFRRGAILFYEQPATLTEGHPIFLDVNGEFFLRPHSYRLCAAGYISPTAENSNLDVPDENVSPIGTLRVTQFAAQLLKGMQSAQPKRGHTIWYDSARDGLPLVGSLARVSGLYVAAGFGASAFSVAPAVGQAVAELVIDGSAPADILSFQPNRT